MMSERLSHMPRQSAKARPLLVGLLLVLAAAVDAGLLVAAVTQSAPLLILAVAHLLIGPLFWLASRRFVESTIAAIGLLAIAAMGPIGALGTLALSITRRVVQPGAPDREWYKTLSARSVPDRDLPKALWQEITDGRARELASSTVTDFRHIISNGTIAEQQAALGLISKRFRSRLYGRTADGSSKRRGGCACVGGCRFLKTAGCQPKADPLCRPRIGYP